MNDYAMDPMLAAMQNERLVEENEALRRENERLLEKGNRTRLLLDQAMPLLAAHGTTPEWLSPDEQKRWELEWEWLQSEYQTIDVPPEHREV